MTIYLTIKRSFVDQNTSMNINISIMDAIYLEDPSKELIGKKTELISQCSKH